MSTAASGVRTVVTACYSKSAVATSKKSASSSVEHATVLSYEYDTAETAVKIASAIAPEIGSIGDDRSRVKIERDGSELRLLIEARDLAALRASINTWCALVAVAEQAGTHGKS
jgi:KEOPS complex subunit Pcc1